MTIVDYEYDFEGNQIARKSVQRITEFLIAGNNLTGYSQVLSEIDDSGVGTEYIYGYGRIAQRRGNSVSYYHQDLPGSTRRLSDANGNFTDSYDYTAFGELQDHQGQTENPFLFTGEQFDPDLNAYNLRARSYAPATGRFLSQDPFNAFHDSNLYAYANNNPMSYTDPTGYYGIPVHVNKTYDWCMTVFMDSIMCVAIVTGDENADLIGRAWVANHSTEELDAINKLEKYLGDQRKIKFKYAGTHEFGRLLHVYQDSFSHCNKGFEDSPSYGEILLKIRDLNECVTLVPGKCWHFWPPLKVADNRKIHHLTKDTLCEPENLGEFWLNGKGPEGSCKPDLFFSCADGKAYPDLWKEIDCNMENGTIHYLKAWHILHGDRWPPFLQPVVFTDTWISAWLYGLGLSF